VLCVEVATPFWCYVAAFDYEVLLVLDRRLHHFTNYGPEILRELLVVLGSEGGVPAADEAHLQVVNGEV
jgi:hypothetical protein